MGKSRGEPLFASAPGKTLNLDAAMLTSHSPRAVSEPYRDAPEGDVPKMTDKESVPISGSTSTRAAKERVTPIRNDVYDDVMRIALDLADTKSLNIKSRFDQLRHMHEFLLGSWCFW